MTLRDTTKPAAACAAGELRNFEQLGGELDDRNIPVGLQVQRLKHKFGFALETAAVVASLAWGNAR